MTATIIFVVIALIAGCAVGYLYSQAKTASALQKATILEADNQRLQQQLAQKEQAVEALNQQRQDLASQREVLRSQLDSMTKSKEEMQAGYEQQLRKSEQQRQEQMEEQRKQHREQMEQQAQLIREQINTASEAILKKRQEELSSTNKEQLETILSPLQMNLKQMKEAVERSDKDHTTSMERLDATIRANMKQAQEVGETADRLAQALTNNNKQQGNFGELRLRTILEQMGLEEGSQFEEQWTMKSEEGRTVHDDESGKRKQPDVILHFPDKRDVIIDSKVSLKAFEDYYSTDDPALKADALSRHIASVRAHVKELSVKTYNEYIPKGHQKLDFVVMFIFSESALQLALSNDPGLWKWAYDQNVIISGSQNLYMMLRVLQMTWRQQLQVENQDNIMKAANEVINRVQVFYERFLNADDQLSKTRRAFDSLKVSTQPSGHGIITAARHLLDYGAAESAKRKYRLPKDEDNLLTQETVPDTEKDS
jgi:DNA recombination protein RmuC